jgi:hypothetical protein
MAKTDPKKYAANLELYEKLVATNPKVQRKGATMPYTSVNGHMFSLFTKDGYLALRLAPDVQQAFLKKYKTTVTEQYGALMKEYIDVPEALLKKTSDLKKYLDLSFSYVSSLKPKPTSKNKTTKKG